MSEDKVSPISGVPPPAHGKWKPGQSGNPKGRPPLKPFREAMARLRKAQQDIDDKICAALATKAETGDTAAIQHWADRSDGKIPQAVGMDPESGPLLVRWLKPGEDE